MLDERAEEKAKIVYDKLLALAMKKGSINADDVYFSMLKVGENAQNIEKFLQSLEKKGIKVIKSNDEDLLKDNFADITMFPNVDDPVKMYLKDIGKVPLLSMEEEKEYAQRAMQGDEYAKSMLCESNLRLVVSVAKR